jgi:hypothetical protein
MRDVAGEDDAGPEEARYAIEHLTFLLDPSQSPERETGAFLIDELPDLSIAYRTPRAAMPMQAKVAIRVTDLIIHDNRVLFGSRFKTDVRVDTIVITGPTSQAQAQYRVETARFNGIRDGDRLPLDNMLIFHGDVAAFVDIRVWVSRDRADSPTLVDLMQRELNSKEFKAAALTLASLVVAAPQAALAVGAIGAAATICNISSRLLSAALGKSIGLYRTSLLAQEGFGTGRHPTSGLLRAQDVSFGYEVLDVTGTLPEEQQGSGRDAGRPAHAR